MYWLLDEQQKQAVRETVGALTEQLALISRSNQSDQLFPFVGRKDRRKASAIVQHLSAPGELVVDPFSGSGIFTYAAQMNDRSVASSEWEPYTHRLSSAPWRVPPRSTVEAALQEVQRLVVADFSYLYRTICPCGSEIVIDSQFFDRAPLSYADVTPHERLGSSGETVTYRGQARCRSCGRTEKMFDQSDAAHLSEVDRIPVLPRVAGIFSRPLIKNSRINLSDEWLEYGKLFPHRSKVALGLLWDAIERVATSDESRMFLQDAFLTILPQAKYKDYRSKSQDLHVPRLQLREVNILTRFIDQVGRRLDGLQQMNLNSTECPISCEDFRSFLSKIEDSKASLVLTDPPWNDGNAYFEKAQLYHPWIDFDLASDNARLEKEVVVTDAPSRAATHSEERWWMDIAEFFRESARVTKDLGYLAVYFRPIPARRWLENLNKLKHYARSAGFEPLLTIDVSSSDPSMRIQQSASYVFASDLVFVFLRLPKELQRRFEREVDLDHLAFTAADAAQIKAADSFSQVDWRREFRDLTTAAGAAKVNLPAAEPLIQELFHRYTRELPNGRFLPRSDTPFTGQLFDVPALERLFAFIPTVVDDLTSGGSRFTFETFLLRLASYVENGTRMLINQVENVDLVRLLSPYTQRAGTSNLFERRTAPVFDHDVARLMEMEPSAFEHFAAELLRRQGFTQVAVMGGSGDRGVDIAARDQNNLSVVVQCKRYVNPVGAQPIQRLHSFSITRGAARRMVVTTSSFTKDAIDEATRTSTELIDGRKLQSLVADWMPDLA